MTLEAIAYIIFAFFAGGLAMSLAAASGRHDRCAQCMFTHATEYPIYDHMDSLEAEAPRDDELPF